MPVTTPEALTVATAVLLLLQAPPDVAFASVVVRPTQAVSVPVIVAGSAPTVATVVTEHPVNSLYVIIVVPAATPVKTPEVTPIVAVVSVPLFQVPPLVALESETTLPIQIAVVPVIADGIGLTVTTIVLAQPEPIA
jgi:hypothetical protein